MDVDALLSLCERCNSHQLVVLQGGEPVVEACWRDAVPSTTFDIASAQKTIVSMAVGGLCAKGVLDLDAPVSTWLGEGWTRTTPEEERTIHLRHLVTMTSGLYDDFRREAEPGTAWYYNNNAYHQARKVLEAATGRSCDELFDDLVFGPAGMTDGPAWIARAWMVDPNGWVLSGLHLSARDLARFGQWVLGRRDDPWVRAAFGPSQELNPAYGFLWWRLGAPRGIVPDWKPEPDDPRKAFGARAVDGPLAPSAPPDTVAALGAGDQKLYVVPSRDLVVARIGTAAHGRDAAASRFDEELWQVLA